MEIAVSIRKQEVPLLRERKGEEGKERTSPSVEISKL